MAQAEHTARKLSSSRSFRALGLDDAARVVVVHASADRDAAVTVVAEMTTAGYDTEIFELERAVVERIARNDPDLTLVVRASDSFSLARLCAELHDVLECRTIVVDFTTSPTGTLAADEEALLVATLDAGADDYVSGHVPPVVLHARVRAALRARPARRRPVVPIEVGDLVIDVQAHTLFIAGTPVSCPPLQFRLLIALASRAEELVRRRALVANVWGVAPESIDGQRVRIAISHLRRIIGEGPQRPTVQTVSRLGYRLTVRADQPWTSYPKSSGSSNR